MFTGEHRAGGGGESDSLAADAGAVKPRFGRSARIPELIAADGAAGAAGRPA